jgi:hypothetical protein
MAVAGILIAGIVSGHIQSVHHAEWSAYNLAANSLALQQIERVKAAKWDPAGMVDKVLQANFPAYEEILDIPISKQNIVYATVSTRITTISTIPPLKLVRIECTWPFLNRGTFTNVVASYRAPDQ